MDLPSRRPSLHTTSDRDRGRRKKGKEKDEGREMTEEKREHNKER